MGGGTWSVAGCPSCPPHDQQKLFTLETSARQCGQVRASRVPHSPQNLAHSGFAAWHRGHRIAGTSRRRTIIGMLVNPENTPSVAEGTAVQEAAAAIE